VSDVFLVGLSHRTAPIAVRERVAFSGETLAEGLADLRARPGVEESLVLSTCNRVEVLILATSAEPARRFLLSRSADAAGYLYERAGREAARHFFRVAASLDSMLVGEQQIAGQVKEAYRLAAAAATAGPHLSRLCARAFVAAKRVRTETEIGRGTTSVSQVAVELVAKIFGNLSGRSVLLVGAGKMGASSAKALASLGADHVLVANRSRDRAKWVARRARGHVRDFSELPQLLTEADVIIVATSAPHFVVTAEMVEATLKPRRYRSMCLIDLSVPRNVDPRCAQFENVFAYDMDDLQRVVRATWHARAEEATRAEAIVEAEVMAFLAERNERAALPVLSALRQRAEAIARLEAQKTLSLMGEHIDEKGRMSVEAMARAIVNKLLHAPTARLKAAAASGDTALPGAAAVLFGIDEAEPARASEPEDASAPKVAMPEQR